MPTLQELQARTSTVAEFAQSVLWPMVDSFESEYKLDSSQLKAKAIVSIPLLAGGWALQLFVKNSGASTNLLKFLGMAAFVACAAGAVILLIELIPFLKQVKRRAVALSKLKASVKQKTVGYLDPSFIFEASVPFPKHIYDSCGLFDSDYDVATAEDRCRGKVGETAFEVFELKTMKVKKSKDSKGNTTTTYIRVFKGLMLIADANKNFNGHTAVGTDRNEKKFGFLARQGQRLMSSMSHLKLVELESPDFESHFKVRSTDAIEARYLLTPLFMESLLALKKKSAVDIQVAFQNSKVIVTIPREQDFMEFQNGIDDLTRSVELMLQQLTDVLGVIDDLDLNNRTYNKISRTAGVS